MTKGVDMTQGTIWKQIVLFSVPIFIGHLLQQTYNAFDSIIVGHYVSSNALAAVSASSALIMMIVSFFVGLSNGASVLISRFFGAKDSGELKSAVHTAIIMSFFVGIFLSVMGVVFSPALLSLMRAPEEAFADAVIYLRIYFAGLTGLTVYNMGAAILTATGDSKRPLYFLTLTTVLKVGMNFLFVLVFDMGVAGVAFSTIIAQALSAVLVIILLCRFNSDVRLELKKLKLHKHILKDIVRLGLPGGIQGALISLSNMIMQAYINGLGVAATAGFGAAARVDMFISIPVMSLTLSTSTFVAQNLGAMQVKRAREGVRVCVRMALGCTIVLCTIVLLLNVRILRIFTSDELVLSYAMQFMRVLVPCYFLTCFNQPVAGALRGAGDIKIPTIIFISYFLGLRQLYLYIATSILYTPTIVALCWPVIWFITAITMTIYYKRSDWSEFEAKPPPQESPPLVLEGDAAAPLFKHRL
jgi:putative MATE family efflux protein